MSLLLLIDTIDRLVFERAEPSAIKPSIISLRDQVEAIEGDAKAKNAGAKLKQAEAKNALLREKNKELTAQLAKAYDEAKRLSNAFTEVQKQNKTDKDTVRTKVEEQLLIVMLSNVPLMTNELIEAMLPTRDKSVQVAINALDRLKFIELRADHTGRSSKPRWHLTPAGRGYSASRNLE